jgi:hypothetical protein
MFQTPGVLAVNECAVQLYSRTIPFEERLITDVWTQQIMPVST